MKNKNLLKKFLRVLIYILVIEGLIMHPVLFKILKRPVKYTIVEEYEFKNNIGEDIRLAILLPKDGAYQTVSNISIDWDKNIEMVDYDSLQVARVSGKFTRHNQKIVAKYDVQIKTREYSWQGNIDNSYLQPSKDIESDSVILKEATSKITKGNTVEDAYKIYTFVSEYLSYPTQNRIGVSQSAIKAYNCKIGGCGEHANLMVAMCRASNIPAKSISGLALPKIAKLSKKAWNHQAGAHAWVEFYADGRWHYADPAWGGKNNFGKIDGGHLSYGCKDKEHKIYLENLKWAKENDIYTIIGSMTAPLKYICSSTGKVEITPMGYIDNNEKYIALAVILMIIIFLEGVVFSKKLKFK
ncbi:transglutaminase-like domain-containing protein [Clostridiaceae bacterium M8S5]|nr:transglutaminase-like domain-containing protein [Clostridiaceae bacterium M8S5]